MLDPKTIAPGQEQHENYTCRVTKKHRCQYDYRASNGKLFSTVAPDLKTARQRRDKWLKDKELEG